MNPVLADIIFPAFYSPYVDALLMSWAGLAALISEGLIFARSYGTRRIGSMLLIVLVANVVSSMAGMGLASLLPTGLNATFLAGSGGPARSESWAALAKSSWYVACLVSIIVEYLVIRFLTRGRRLEGLPFVVAGANVCSYLVLLEVVRLSVTLRWG